MLRCPVLPDRQIAQISRREYEHLSFAFETIPSAEAVCHRLRNFQEGPSGVRERGRFSIDQAQFAMHVQFLYRNAYQFAAREFVLYADLGQESDAIPERNKSLDRLQRWQLHR